MKKTRSLALSSVAGAAILGITFAIPNYGGTAHASQDVSEISEEAKGQALSQEVGTQATNIDVSIDPVEIGNSIRDAIVSSNNREGFVKAARETMKFQSDYQLNVMVLNMSLDYESSLSGVHYFDTFTYDGVIYGIWAFEEGTFNNKGDGGYINWAFSGWFDRNDGEVEFRLP
ncbi:stress protein [Alkalicoccobacillus gibsonii]|uniref:Stress protein n=1 Tax=Alkalicoccobacillus gibsonii TaxID=79881 RepID=A0ABU9VI21_9BACI